MVRYNSIYNTGDSAAFYVNSIVKKNINTTVYQLNITNFASYQFWQIQILTLNSSQQ